MAPTWLMMGVGGGSAIVAAASSGGGPTTLNPSDKAASVTLSGGNLVMTTSAAGSVRSIASYSNGKKYCEVLFGSTAINAYDHAVGAANSSASLTAGPGSPDTNSIAYYNGDTNIYAGGASAGNTGLTAVAGDLVSQALDLDNDRIWIRLNGGNWNNSSANDPATNTGGIDVSAVAKPWFALGYGAVNNSVNSFNFGSSAYAYTPPSGFGNW